MKNTFRIISVAILLILNVSWAPVSGANIESSNARTYEQQENSTDSVLKFTLPEHDLYPENIAYDPVSRSYFLGSMSQCRIIRIKEDGSYEDFISSPETGLISSIGMKVDTGRRFLWVCSGRLNLMRDFESLPAKTGILKFNIDTGKLIDKWILDEDQASHYHIFNDLVLASNGDVYATTTLLGRVYKISAENNEIEVILQLKQGSHNNGITLDDQEKYLFLTIDRSIFRYEIESKKLIELDSYDKAALSFTDGLYFHNGSLVAVKPRLNQIIQLFLDAEYSRVDSAVILAQDPAEFVFPTTGVVVKDTLVFVATSYANIPRNYESVKQHQDIKIHEVALKQKPK